MATYRINSIFQSNCAPDWTWQSPPMPDFDLWVVVSGEGTLAACDSNPSNLQTPERAHPGKAFLLRPGKRYLGEHKPRHPLRVIAAHFDTDLDHAEALTRLPWCTNLLDLSLCQRLLTRTLATWPQQADLAQVFFQAAVGEYIHSAHHESRHPSEVTIDQCCAQIGADPQHNWDIAALAAACGWSRHYFSRRFSARVGMAPQEFVIAERLRAAQALLLESNLPINRIAEELGYSDTAFFSRQFTQKIGSSPVAFRQQHQAALGLHQEQPG